MRTKGTIAVVIPVRNRETLIGRALNSVLAQSRPPDEIWVVDDGSTDRSASVARDHDCGAQLLATAGVGAGEARNVGVRACATEWVAFLDSDDHWDAGHLQRMELAVAATEGAAGLYFADTMRPREEDSASLWSLAAFAPERPLELRADGSEWVLLARQPMMLQSSLFRRDHFLELGGFDGALTRRHDTHLFFRAGLGLPICAVHGIGAFMTNDASEGRLTTSLGSQSRVYWDCTRRLYADVLAEHPRLAPSDRKELRRRLAAAHARLARHDWAEGRRLASLGNVLATIRLDPARLRSGLRAR